MTTVMCFGTFDIIHPGHLNYFKQAKKYGNYLVVVIGRDKNVKKEKLLHDEKERLKKIKALKIVDQAVLGNLKDHFKIIEEIKPDVICLGYDHKITGERLKKELNNRNLKPQVKRMRAYKTDKYQSSKIKRQIK